MFATASEKTAPPRTIAGHNRFPLLDASGQPVRRAVLQAAMAAAVDFQANYPDATPATSFTRAMRYVRGQVEGSRKIWLATRAEEARFDSLPVDAQARELRDRHYDLLNTPGASNDWRQSEIKSLRYRIAEIERVPAQMAEAA